MATKIDNNCNVTIFIGCSYKDKDLAKSFGAKFDKNRKKWYFTYEFDEFCKDVNKHSYFFTPLDIGISKCSGISESDRCKHMSSFYRTARARSDNYKLNNVKPLPVANIDDPFSD